MSRIDIEGAIPLLSEHYLGGYSQQLVGNERQKQQFARYLSPRVLPMAEMADAITTVRDRGLISTDYCIASGPLRGTRVSVSLAVQGLTIVLSHTNGELVERLQRIQSRWQRQLHLLGFPCWLEVIHVRESDG